MKLVKAELPSDFRKKYRRILAEFDASGMESAKIEVEPCDSKPISVWHGLRKAVSRYPEYSYIGVSFTNGEIFLYRKE